MVDRNSWGITAQTPTHAVGREEFVSTQRGIYSHITRIQELWGCFITARVLHEIDVGCIYHLPAPPGRRLQMNVEEWRGGNEIWGNSLHKQVRCRFLVIMLGTLLASAAAKSWHPLLRGAESLYIPSNCATTSPLQPNTYAAASCFLLQILHLLFATYLFVLSCFLFSFTTVSPSLYYYNCLVIKVSIYFPSYFVPVHSHQQNSHFLLLHPYINFYASPCACLNVSNVICHVCICYITRSVFLSKHNFAETTLAFLLFFKNMCVFDIEETFTQHSRLTLGYYNTTQRILGLPLWVLHWCQSCSAVIVLILVQKEAWLLLL